MSILLICLNEECTPIRCNSGTCNITDGSCSCNSDYYGEFCNNCMFVNLLCLSKYFTYKCIYNIDCNDVETCNSHGYCSDSGLCVCEYGFAPLSNCITCRNSSYVGPNCLRM